MFLKIELKKAWVVIFTVAFLLYGFAKKDPYNMGPTTCYIFAGNNTELIKGAGQNCSGSVSLFFHQENDFILPQCELCETVTIYFDEGLSPQLAFYFSDEELVDIIDHNRFHKEKISVNQTTRCKLLLPAFSLDTEEGQEVISQIFTSTEEYTIMKHPISSNNVYLYDIDYVKFPGMSLMPVPPPLA
jgi:hypothetical protein